MNEDFYLRRQLLSRMAFQHAFGVAHHLLFEIRIFPALLNQYGLQLPARSSFGFHMNRLSNVRHQTPLPFKALPTVAAAEPAMLTLRETKNAISVPPATFSRSSSDSSERLEGVPMGLRPTDRDENGGGRR